MVKKENSQIFKSLFMTLAIQKFKRNVKKYPPAKMLHSNFFMESDYKIHYLYKKYLIKLRETIGRSRTSSGESK
jgi:hypothetical protein